MPIQIKMNMNLSNRSLSRSDPSVVLSVPTHSLASSSSSSSSRQFQYSMIDRIHLSKSGCSSCGH